MIIICSEKSSDIQGIYIHKIVEEIGITDKLSNLIPQVRAVRSELSICPSAKEGVCIADILRNIMDEQVYKKDYDDITLGLLFVPETYDTVVQSIVKMVDSGIWDN